MLEFLSKEVLAGLDAARKSRERKASRLRVQVGEAVYPVLRFSPGGCVLDGKFAPHLRGLVDIYDGSIHLAQCLIVATTVDGDEISCEFKRMTPVADRPALDFWQEEAPKPLLPRA